MSSSPPACPYIYQKRFVVFTPFVQMSLTINTIYSTLSQLELDNFYNTFGIDDSFGPLLPGPDDTIRDFPPEKLVYTLGL